MRHIEWASVLREHRVPFTERGANVKRNEINIRCPFCGSADPSMHMGLNLETGWWSCWRNKAAHSGKSPVRLLMKLLSVPYRRAREIAGLGDDFIDPEGFDALAARLMRRGDASEGRPEQIERRFLDLDPDFLPIRDKAPTRQFWNYLYERGFNGSSPLGEDVDVLCEDYGLRCAIRGDQQGRVVLPYIMEGELVTWSGRAIGSAEIRYKDLLLEECIVKPKHTLFNHDAIYRGGTALVLVEGPFDALKIDFYGKPWGVRAVALSTNSIQREQVDILMGAEGFASFLVMADNAKATDIVHSMRLKQELYGIPNLRVVGVPDGAKDAGELRPRQVIKWASALK